MCALLGSASAISATPTPKAKAKPTGPHPTAKSPTKPGDPNADRVIWEAWYTITLKDGSHYAYYQDRAELRGGKAYFQENVWKNEEGFINEEQVGTFSEPTPDLTPVLFSFHANYRGTETLIDGNIPDGRTATIKVRKGNQDLPPIKRMLPSKTILATAFPLWIKEHAADIPVGGSRSITVLYEDQVDAGFPAIVGRVHREKNPTAGGAMSFVVDIADVKSHWVLNGEGIVERMEMPSFGRLVQKVSAEKARSFFTSGP